MVTKICIGISGTILIFYLYSTTSKYIKMQLSYIFVIAVRNLLKMEKLYPRILSKNMIFNFHLGIDVSPIVLMKMDFIA